jgi:hypothetical protein
MAVLYRKRLIPSECIELKDDVIADCCEDYIITRWNTLHPKEEFSHGISFYFIKEGWKISKFFKENGELVYVYCDIIDTSADSRTDTYTFTDLLADVIIENDGFVRVVDLDELGEACSTHIISEELLVTALGRLDKLLNVIYDGTFKNYLAVLERFEEK